MTSVGPFSLRVALAAGAILLAWVVTNNLTRRMASEHRPAQALLLDAILVGFIAARAGYILQWWAEYRAAPFSMVAIGDGGFAWWAGLPVALAFLVWRSKKAWRALLLPALAGMAIGILAWVMAGYMISALLQSAPPLPDLVLETPEGVVTPMSSYQGRPVVVNLWATWCPPCRREMPIFAHAQQAWPEVSFLLVNQGDDRALVNDYLERAGLELRDVLLDPGSRTMQESGARVLPTTLFFDPEGRLVDTHVGELTRAGLADRLQRRLGVPVR